mmetsp:Transcript_6876/g.12307  ORF Transcript_6876/g.12307 Transcript_6876/m.12307 type:complete len:94 (-) Transcript_6876:823-1104(-)
MTRYNDSIAASKISGTHLLLHVYTQSIMIEVLLHESAQNPMLKATKSCSSSTSEQPHSWNPYKILPTFLIEFGFGGTWALSKIHADGVKHWVA